MYGVLIASVLATIGPETTDVVQFQLVRADAEKAAGRLKILLGPDAKVTFSKVSNIVFVRAGSKGLERSKAVLKRLDAWRYHSFIWLTNVDPNLVVRIVGFAMTVESFLFNDPEVSLVVLEKSRGIFFRATEEQAKSVRWLVRQLDWLAGTVVGQARLTDADKLERETAEKGWREFFGDPPEHFVKHIKPLVEGIKKAKALTLYEGLPHQFHERQLLAKELKEQKTVKLHDFPFYEGAIAVKDDDAKKLLSLCSDLKTFGRYGGKKMCGGYHPDWYIEFKAGDDIYQVQICFGCHEARLFGPKNEVFSDLDNEALKKLAAVFVPLRKNRPKRESEK